MAKVYWNERKQKYVCDYVVANMRKRPEFSTKAEADSFRREVLLRDIDRLTGFTQIEEVTPREACDEYLEVVSAMKQPETIKLEELYFEKFVDFCNAQKIPMLCDINFLDIQKFRSALRKDLMASTVNRYFNTYKNFFKYCVKWKFISENPTTELVALPESKKTIMRWTPKTFSQVCEIVPIYDAAAFFFVVKSGARRGEVTKLLRSDVDLDLRTASLRSWKGGVCEIRTIPMTDELTEVMAGWLRTHKHKLVFCYPDGKAFHKSHLSSQLNRALKKLDLTGLTLHGLRHGISADLARRNVSIRKIQMLLGHKNLATTERYLGNVMNDDLRHDLEELENVIKFKPRHLMTPGETLNPEKEAK